MTITALPTPPSRNDPANFAERGDAFLAALPTFQAEANALQADVNAKQAAAATSASNAATSATNSANSATAAANSATSASNSATAAGTSATNAGNSATAAANSATQADGFRQTAADWAQKIGAAVVAGMYSAKEWAVGTFTRGAAGGGSAKDWATYTGGTVDDTERSAKYYAQQAATTLANKLDKTAGGAIAGPISATAIDNTPIGQTTPAAGSFAYLQSSSGLRSTGSNTTYTGAGAGVEVEYAASEGWVTAYDRGAGAWKPLNIRSSKTTFVVGGSTAMTLDASSNLGIGVTPSAWYATRKAIEIGGVAQLVSTGVNLELGSNWYNDGLYKYKTSAAAALYTPSNGAHTFYVSPSGTAGNTITFTQAMTLDNSGNWLVGVTSGTEHKIAGNKAQGAAILHIVESNSGNGWGAASFFATGTNGYNAAAAAVKFGSNTTTSRSINAGGTINASGADYAEYMRKAESCGLIAKGAIVGVNAEGELTDKWTEAVSFLIKSTNPSYVGGDTWGSEEALGVVRPVEPQFTAPSYEGAADPGEAPLSPAEPEDGASEEQIAAYFEALNQYKEAAAAYKKARAAYDMDQAEYAARVEVAKQIFEEATLPAYQQELETFDAALEAARQKVDRIAFSGQVPVNVLGAVPGQYVVPVQDGEGIGAILVSESAMTLKQYMRAVGVVQNILGDGRANVRVKVV